MAYPMGARMMSGQTKYHEQLEQELAEFMHKEDAFLLNFGYQGCMSAIEALRPSFDFLHARLDSTGSRRQSEPLQIVETEYHIGRRVFFRSLCA
jgi:hypothetical protein